MFGKGAIILLIGFGIIFGFIGLRLNNLENRAIGNMAYYFDINQSHNLAVAGANAGISRIYQDSSLRGVITNQTFTSGLFKGGSFTVRVDSLNVNTLRLRSVSQYKNYRDTVEVFFSKQRFQSFSMFAWMTNFEGNDVFWITGDTVWGRVHSNGNIHISGSPVFMEKLTTAKKIDPKPGSGQSNGIYKKGYETGVAPIQFPTDLSEILAASTSGGRRYTTNIWVTLSPGTSSNNDGVAYIRTSAGGPIVDSIFVNDPSFNGVIYSTQQVTVQGQLDGKLTISSGTNIIIADDVVYERNPLVIPTSDDLLGLVANGNVIVADNTANRNNCEIHAAIFSRIGSFVAEDYNNRPISGWLRVVGGIIQDTRGKVGTFTGSGTLKTGFSKRYYFDPRLADVNTRPPYFPGYYRKTLAIVNGWENVRIPTF